MKRFFFFLLLLGGCLLARPFAGHAQDIGSEYGPPDDTFLPDDAGNSYDPTSDDGGDVSYDPGDFDPSALDDCGCDPPLQWYEAPDAAGDTLIFAANISTNETEIYNYQNGGVKVYEDCVTSTDPVTGAQLGKDCDIRVDPVDFDSIAQKSGGYDYSGSTIVSNPNVPGLKDPYMHGDVISGTFDVSPSFGLGGDDPKADGNKYSATANFNAQINPGNWGAGVLAISIHFDLDLSHGSNISSFAPQFSVSVMAPSGQTLTSAPIFSDGPMDPNTHIQSFTLGGLNLKAGGVTDWHNKVVVIELTSGYFDGTGTNLNTWTGVGGSNYVSVTLPSQ